MFCPAPSGLCEGEHGRELLVQGCVLGTEGVSSGRCGGAGQQGPVLPLATKSSSINGCSSAVRPQDVVLHGWRLMEARPLRWCCCCPSLLMWNHGHLDQQPPGNLQVEDRYCSSSHHLALLECEFLCLQSGKFKRVLL